MPRPERRRIAKSWLLEQLAIIDRDQVSQQRILRIENRLRDRITSHIDALPIETAEFAKFNTSPFVLMVYCHQKRYRFVDEIERDILPAKLFSSMETSAGRMIQEVVLPVYGWEGVPSSMHSSGSVIDGRKQEGDSLKLVTIKSGPRCLNDEMSKDIADDIVAHAEHWADKAGVDRIDFTYAVLYGTPKQSNKKDWHVLRNIVEIKGPKFIIDPPIRKWNCSFRHRGARIDVSVRIGTDWWTLLGGEHALSELLIALIRACVIPAGVREDQPSYVIRDLGSIVSTDCVPAEFNVSILQRSQLEWLFFLARHFCDELSDGTSYPFARQI